MIFHISFIKKILNLITNTLKDLQIDIQKCNYHNILVSVYYIQNAKIFLEKTIFVNFAQTYNK